MLKVNLEVEHHGTLFTFTAEVQKGIPHTFEIGETQLADKLFHTLCGLTKSKNPQENPEKTPKEITKKYPPPIKTLALIDTDNQLNLSKSPENNILALGDPTMFLAPSSSIKKNIYRALRSRHSRPDSKQKTSELLSTYFPNTSPKTKLKTLDSNQLLTLSLARSHYRTPKLIIINKLHFLKSLEINLSLWKNCYILTIC